MSQRRSISVRGETYWRLRGYCDTRKVSMSDVVEGLLRPVLAAGETAPSPAVQPVPAPPLRRPLRAFVRAVPRHAEKPGPGPKDGRDEQPTREPQPGPALAEKPGADPLVGPAWRSF